MFDYDLASLYEVSTKVMNQSIKRNISRFPIDFMFKLTEQEWTAIKSNFGEPQLKDPENQLDKKDLRWSQFVTTSNKFRPLHALPYAFTEQGIAMLSSILHSEKAIAMNIAIMRAFVQLRNYSLQKAELWAALEDLQEKVGKHDLALSAIYTAIERLLAEKASQKSWEERVKIGFVSGTSL